MKYEVVLISAQVWLCHTITQILLPGLLVKLRKDRRRVQTSHDKLGVVNWPRLRSRPSTSTANCPQRIDSVQRRMHFWRQCKAISSRLAFPISLSYSPTRPIFFAAHIARSSPVTRMSYQKTTTTPLGRCKYKTLNITRDHFLYHFLPDLSKVRSSTGHFCSFLLNKVT